MKRTTLTHVLMAGLAICLLTACTKEEEVYNLSIQSDRSPSIVTYEANWVVDGQFVDQTKFVFRSGESYGIFEIDHMPNDVLLKDLLEKELRQQSVETPELGEAVTDHTPFFSRNETLGFSDKTNYINSKNNKMDAYGIFFGTVEYVVVIDYQIDATYNRDSDQWMIKWTVNSVYCERTRGRYYVTATHTFEPALTMLLVSTKRLH